MVHWASWYMGRDRSSTRKTLQSPSREEQCNTGAQKCSDLGSILPSQWHFHFWELDCWVLDFDVPKWGFLWKSSIVEIRDKVRHLAHNKRGWGHFGLEKISCFPVSAHKWFPAYTSLNNCLESFLFSELPQTWAQAAVFACSHCHPSGDTSGQWTTGYVPHTDETEGPQLLTQQWHRLEFIQHISFLLLEIWAVLFHLHQQQPGSCPWQMAGLTLVAQGAELEHWILLFSAELCRDFLSGSAGALGISNHLCEPKSSQIMSRQGICCCDPL